MPLRITGLLAAGVLVLASCGSDGASGEVPGEVSIDDPPEATVGSVDASQSDTGGVVMTTPQGDVFADGTLQRVPSRLLVDGAAVGEAWTTAIITPDDVWAIDPAIEIDADSDVLLQFVLAESSTPECAVGPFIDLVVRPADQRVFPVVTPFWVPAFDGDEIECNADANPHAVIVAVDRADMPIGDFTMWVDGDVPPAGVGGNVLFVPAGEFVATLSAGELNVAGGVDGPVVFGRALDGGEEAEIRGVVEYDGTCLTLSGTAVVWRFGTSWDESEQAIVADGQLVRPGDAVETGGGYGDLGQIAWVVDDPDAVQLLQACSPDGSVAIVQHPVTVV